MGHTIQLVLAGHTTVELNSGNILCGDFRWISDTTAELDLLIKDTTSALVQYYYNLIEARMEQAKDRQNNPKVEPVYLTVQWAGESTAWRSEVVEGEMLLVERSLDQLVSFKMECKLIVTHQTLWEAASETELSLKSQAAASALTGGVTIYNHDDSGTGQGNYVDVLEQYIDGVLPAACRIILRNSAGTSVGYENIYMGHMKSPAVTTFDHVLEGEDTTAGGGTVSGADSGTHDGIANSSQLQDSTKTWTLDQWVGFIVRNVTKGATATITGNGTSHINGTLSGGADWDVGDEYAIQDTTNYSGGYYYARNWTGALSSNTMYTFSLPGSLLEAANGGYFRLMARLASSPNSSTYVKVQLFHQTTIKLYETQEVKLSENQLLKDLGAIQLPPVLARMATLGDLTMSIVVRSGATGTFNLDFIQMIPADTWRHLKVLGTTYANGTEFVDDGMDDRLYTDEGGTDIFGNLIAKGKRIKLLPGNAHRIYFLFDETASMNIGRTNVVQMYYRPRRRTI